MLNVKFFLKLIISAFVLVNSNLFIAFAEQKVSKILIEGNQRVDDDTILSFITLSEGSSYVDIDVNVILKDLYKTGLIFKSKWLKLCSSIGSVVTLVNVVPNCD